MLVLAACVLLASLSGTSAQSVTTVLKTSGMYMSSNIAGSVQYNSYPRPWMSSVAGSGTSWNLLYLSGTEYVLQQNFGSFECLQRDTTGTVGDYSPFNYHVPYLTTCDLSNVNQWWTFLNAGPMTSDGYYQYYINGWDTEIQLLGNIRGPLSFDSSIPQYSAAFPNPALVSSLSTGSIWEINEQLYQTSTRIMSSENAFLDASTYASYEGYQNPYLASTSTGSSMQQWAFRYRGGNQYQIQSIGSNFCLTSNFHVLSFPLTPYDPQFPAPLVKECDSYDGGQRWTVAKASGNSYYNHVYTITSGLLNLALDGNPVATLQYNPSYPNPSLVPTSYSPNDLTWTLDIPLLPIDNDCYFLGTAYQTGEFAEFSGGDTEGYIAINSLNLNLNGGSIVQVSSNGYVTTGQFVSSNTPAQDGTQCQLPGVASASLRQVQEQIFESTCYSFSVLGANVPVSQFYQLYLTRTAQEVNGSLYSRTYSQCNIRWTSSITPTDPPLQVGGAASGAYIITPNGHYTLTIDSGYFTLAEVGTHVLWQQYVGPCTQCQIQVTSTTFGVYDPSTGTWPWSQTPNSKKTLEQLAIQEDGNLCAYYTGHTLAWTTNTNSGAGAKVTQPNRMWWIGDTMVNGDYTLVVTCADDTLFCELVFAKSGTMKFQTSLYHTFGQIPYGIYVEGSGSLLFVYAGNVGKEQFNIAPQSVCQNGDCTFGINGNCFGWQGNGNDYSYCDGKTTGTTLGCVGIACSV